MLRNKNMSQINHSGFHPKKLEKKNKPKISRREKTIKFKAKINEIKIRKTIEKYQ